MDNKINRKLKRPKSSQKIPIATLPLLNQQQKPKMPHPKMAISSQMNLKVKWQFRKLKRQLKLLKNSQSNNFNNHPKLFRARPILSTSMVNSFQLEI